MRGCLAWSHAALGMCRGCTPRNARTSNAQSLADDRHDAPCDPKQHHASSQSFPTLRGCGERECFDLCMIICVQSYCQTCREMCDNWHTSMHAPKVLGEHDWHMYARQQYDFGLSSPSTSKCGHFLVVCHPPANMSGHVHVRTAAPSPVEHSNRAATLGATRRHLPHASHSTQQCLSGCFTSAAVAPQAHAKSALPDCRGSQALQAVHCCQRSVVLHIRSEHPRLNMTEIAPVRYVILARQIDVQSTPASSLPRDSKRPPRQRVNGIRECTLGALTNS
jgi:hypothetical protein